MFPCGKRCAICIRRDGNGSNSIVATSAGGQSLLAGLLMAAPHAGWAADAPPPPGWYSAGGLSFVMASGNSGASTLGAKAEEDARQVKGVVDVKNGIQIKEASADTDHAAAR